MSTFFLVVPIFMGGCFLWENDRAHFRKEFRKLDENSNPQPPDGMAETD